MLPCLSRILLYSRVTLLSHHPLLHFCLSNGHQKKGPFIGNTTLDPKCYQGCMVNKWLITIDIKSGFFWTPSKWPNFMACYWGVILTTYHTWDDSSNFSGGPIGHPRLTSGKALPGSKTFFSEVALEVCWRRSLRKCNKQTYIALNRKGK